MSGNGAVWVKNLSKRFGKDFVAVDNISFSVERSAIYGFLGPNGAGKSTTIRMLCGILLPTSGQGEVGGFDIMRQSDKIKENIGYMSQRFSLYDDLSVRQNLEFYAGIYRVPRKKRAERIAETVAMAGLEGLENNLTGALSGGWKQRLALGASILHEPSILFLDEPTAGVDPISRRKFWDLIHDMKKRGVTVFVTTHYMDEAEHCDTLSLISAGQIIASASPRSLKADAISGTLLNVSVEPLNSALSALNNSKDFECAQIFGSAIHVAALRQGDVAGAARAMLEATGCRVQSVDIIRPSLEDAFIALVQKQTRSEMDRFEPGGRA